MAILKTHYSDYTDGFRKYAPGDDVSHIAESELKFLRKNGHLEKEEGDDENIETVKQKGKSKKVSDDENIETVND